MSACTRLEIKRDYPMTDIESTELLSDVAHAIGASCVIMLQSLQ